MVPAAIIFRKRKWLFDGLNSRSRLVNSPNLQIGKQTRLGEIQNFTPERHYQNTELLDSSSSAPSSGPDCLLYRDKEVAWKYKYNLEVGRYSQAQSKSRQMFCSEKRISSWRRNPPSAVHLYTWKLALNAVYEMCVRIGICVKTNKQTLSQWITWTLPLGWRANDQVSSARCSLYISSI